MYIKKYVQIIIKICI